MFSIGVSCWYYEVILQKRKFNMAKKYSNTGYCKCILIILRILEDLKSTCIHGWYNVINTICG